MTTLTERTPPKMSEPLSQGEIRVEPGPAVLPALWTAKWSILVVGIFSALIGFGLSALQPETFQSSAELLLTDPRNTGVFEDTGINFLDPSRYVRNQAELARSTTVMAEASTQIGGRLEPDELDDLVNVRPSVDLDLLTITAEDGTGAGAAELANAVADAYQVVVERQVQTRTAASVAELREQRVQLEETIADAEVQIASGEVATGTSARDGALQQLVSINNRIDQIAVDASLFGAGVDLAESAPVPDLPASPQPHRNAILAFVLGVLAASGWAWWRADETATANDRNDATEMLRAPLLGTVPAFEASNVKTPLPTISTPTSPVAEAYQFLVNSIAHALTDIGGTSVLFTSAGPTDGKTLTAANFGIAAAQDGREVLLIDADTRIRGLTRLFDVEAELGLSALTEGRPLIDVVTLLEAGERHVALLPAVPLGQDTAAFFRTPGFRQAARAMNVAADLVLYDTPPLLLASDTSAIAAHVDGIVVIVSRGTPVRQLEALRERLDHVGTPVIGYVFTKDRVDAGYGYGYRYGYKGYGTVED